MVRGQKQFMRWPKLPKVLPHPPRFNGVAAGEFLYLDLVEPFALRGLNGRDKPGAVQFSGPRFVHLFILGHQQIFRRLGCVLPQQSQECVDENALPVSASTPENE